MVMPTRIQKESS